MGRHLPRAFFCIVWLGGSQVLTAQSQAVLSQGALPESEAPVCPPTPATIPDLPPAEVYKDMPFQPGEAARYILKYGLFKVHVGYGFLRVEAPTSQVTAVGAADGKILTEPRLHRSFSAEAYTGDWYKLVFVGHDTMQAYSLPQDFRVTKFYLSQDEEKPFVRRFRAEKWLDFDQVACKVTERQVDHKKGKESNGEHFLHPGAVDALGGLYKLRTFAYELNKTERFMVYTSEKNWWLEATPVALETLKTSLGKLKAYKLAIKSYLGKELQQRGKLFVWVAAEHPNRPLLRIEGSVTFGAVYLELDQFTAGQAH